MIGIFSYLANIDIDIIFDMSKNDAEKDHPYKLLHHKIQVRALCRGLKWRIGRMKALM